MNKQQTQDLHVILSKQEHRGIRKLARSLNLTVSDMIRDIIKCLLEQQEKKTSKENLVSQDTTGAAVKEL